MNWKQLKQAIYMPGLPLFKKAQLGFMWGPHRSTLDFHLHVYTPSGATVYTWWRFQLTVFKEQS